MTEPTVLTLYITQYNSTQSNSCYGPVFNESAVGYKQE